MNREAFCPGLRRSCRITLAEGPASSDSQLERGEQFGQPFNYLCETVRGELDWRRQNARFNVASRVPPHEIGRMN